MRIDRQTLVFFDASCLIAAAGSPSGGSGFLLSVCGRGFLRGAVSQPVLSEAERNVLTKLDADAHEAYRRMVALTPLAVVAVGPEERRFHEQIIGEKDGHVVAAAVAAHAPFLITLDKPLIARVNAANLAVRALSPGDFITTVLPDHVDYAAIR